MDGEAFTDLGTRGLCLSRYLHIEAERSACQGSPHPQDSSRRDLEQAAAAASVFRATEPGKAVRSYQIVKSAKVARFVSPSVGERQLPGAERQSRRHAGPDSSLSLGRRRRGRKGADGPGRRSARGRGMRSRLQIQEKKIA
jgi:hypothetical protein